MSDDKMLNTSWNVMTAYGLGGNQLNLKKLLEMDIPELQQAISRVVPKIQKKFPEIKATIERYGNPIS